MELKSRINAKVYKIVKKVPKGKVTTYGIVAEKARTSARAIGQIMKSHNTDMPCHRVVMSNGSVGGYRGKHYSEKIRKLKREGLRIKNKKIINFEKVFFHFNS